MSQRPCPHCGSAFAEADDGCCPACGQALSLPPSDADVWFPYHPTEQLFQRACAGLLGERPEPPSPTGRRWRWFLISLLLSALVLLAGNSAAKSASSSASSCSTNSATSSGWSRSATGT